ncbi:MAG: response regulator [Desulfobacteraceae bacterium]|nr:response regulator [Desulfobacteraceae bacterium]
MVDKLDIIVADDNPDFVHLFKELCTTISGINIPGIARSKAMLVAKINSGKPDLVLLDLTPDMGGIQMVDTIRKANPGINVIITYDPDNHDADMLVQALEMGVYECIEKPISIESRQYSEFRLLLLTIIGLLISRKRFSSKPILEYKNKFFMPVETEDKLPDKPSKPVPFTGKIDIVVIASSTGGPEILSQIFSILPGNLNIPILLVQHIPADMTQYFAKSLNGKSELDIFQAAHGDQIMPSKVYVAPGGQHMTVSKPDNLGQRTIQLDNSPSVNSVRPSADILFESIAKSYKGNILAIVLTGMGEDGKNGVAEMKNSGCLCISQKAETCVVYGMPRAVDDAGLSDESLDPLNITQKIVMMVQQNLSYRSS